MPTFVITNNGRSRLSVNAAVGTVGPYETKSVELTNEEIDVALMVLSDLVESGAVTVQINSTSASEDDNFEVVRRSELFPQGNVIHYYVSGTGGSDENDGRTPRTAFRTIDAALDKVGPVVTTNTVVHISSYSGYTLNRLQTPRVYHRNLVLIGDGGGQSGDDGFTEVVTGAAQSGSDRVTLVTSGGLGVDTHIGLTVEILTSANAANVGARRQIRDHDDTTITPTLGFPAALTAGDTFRIVSAGAATASMAGKLLYGSDVRSTQYVDSNTGRLFVVNMTIGTSGTFFLSGSWGFYGTRVNSGQFRDAFLTAGNDTGAMDTTTVTVNDASYMTSLFSLVDAQSWLGWGLFSSTTTTSFDVVSGRCVSFVSGGRLSMFGRNRILYLNLGRITQASASFSALKAEGGSSLIMGAGFSGAVSGANVDWLVTHSGTSATSRGFELENNAYVAAYNVRVELAGTTAPGYYVNTGSLLRAGSSVGNPVVAGGNYGILCSYAGKAYVNGSGTTIADGSTPPATANFAAGVGAGLGTAASFGAAGNAIAGASSDGSPVLDGSVIQRI